MPVLICSPVPVWGCSFTDTSLGYTVTPPVRISKSCRPSRKLHVAQLLHAQAAPVGTELGRQAVEPDHAMHQRLQAKAAAAAHGRISQDHRAVVLEQAWLERLDVETVARALACQMAQLRQAVDHDPGRPELVDTGPDPLDDLGELDLRGMEQGLLTCLAEDPPQVGEVHDLDARRATSRAMRRR